MELHRNDMRGDELQRNGIAGDDWRRNGKAEKIKAERRKSIAEKWRAKMAYKFAIEKFTIYDEDNCDAEIVHQESGLSLIQALNKVKEFVSLIPDGYLLESGPHSIEYEIDGAELSCWVDIDY